MALSLIRKSGVRLTLHGDHGTLLFWLIDHDAPTILVVTLLADFVRTYSLNPNKIRLLEHCMEQPVSKANALETFCSLLALGLSPNVLAGSGATLLQKAMAENRVRHVIEMLRFGLDPFQKSAFGSESASNIEEAKLLDTLAANLVWQKYSGNTVQTVPDIYGPNPVRKPFFR